MSKTISYSTSLFLGSTTGGIEQPVFWDPHTQIFNNNPPGSLITGSPGSGKTFLAMTLTCQSSILGKTTIVLDPKGDFLTLKNLEEDLGELNIWNLSDRSKRGLLDPFYMAEDLGERLNLVISVIDMFVGGISKDERRALSPIVQDIMKGPKPSLLKVTETLRMSQNPSAKNLGTELDLIRKLPFADLCFAPGTANRNNVSINTGTTLITMVGLDITPPSENVRQTSTKRLSSTIFFLITDFIRRVMHKSTGDVPKTLIIDEAWAVLASQEGADVIREVALLGRSKNLALIMITQNTSHLKSLDIDNTIRTRFAFHTDSKEATDIIHDMQLPEGERFEDNLTNLDIGECLMQDFMGRYSTVQISDYNKKWKYAFETNPMEHAKRKQRQKSS